MIQFRRESTRASDWTQSAPPGGTAQRFQRKKNSAERLDGMAQHVLGTAAAGVRNRGGALPFADRIQASFGRHDISGISASTDGAASQANSALGARAYALGDRIAFAQTPDLHTAAHEAAHVVQQRHGVSLKDGIGRPGDVHEVHADAVAQAVVSGKSAESLLDRYGKGPGGAPAVQQLQRNEVTTFVEGAIIGHASPRWEHPRDGSREDLNLRLSRDRAERVRQYVTELFRAAYSTNPVQFALQVESVNAADADGPGVSGVGAVGVGDRDTLVEAGGDTSSNDPAMRRADMRIAITHQVSGAAPATEGRSSTVTTPGACTRHSTNQWAISMALSGGAGHAGIGGAFALGKLKNRRTNQELNGAFVGGGIGVGLQTPGADPGWGGWVNFTSQDICTFADYDNTLARLTMAGAGIAIIGYSLAWISFPLRGANSIYVGGFNMGAFGADAGTNVGVWTFTDPVPAGTTCEPDRTETVTAPYTASHPYRFDIHNNLSHVVQFETGVSELSDAELARLQEYVQRIAEQYRAPSGTTRR